MKKKKHVTRYLFVFMRLAEFELKGVTRPTRLAGPLCARRLLAPTPPAGTQSLDIWLVVDTLSGFLVCLAGSLTLRLLLACLGLMMWRLVYLILGLFLVGSGARDLYGFI